MNEINTRLYDYYTLPENFSCIVNIYRDFPLVQKQLIEEFFKDVASDIKRLLNTKEWYIEYVNENDEYETQIAISPNSVYSAFPEKTDSSCWLSYWHCTGRCYLRLWLGEGILFDYAKITKKAEEFKSAEWRPVKVSKKGDEEVLWKWADLDFTNLESLESILPSHRKIMVEKFAQRMADAATTLKPFMEFIHKSRK